MAKVATPTYGIGLPWKISHHEVKMKKFALKIKGDQASPPVPATCVFSQFFAILG